MSDLAMTRFMASKAVGSRFWVRPVDLQMSPELFHASVQSWVASQGGGDFLIVKAHKPSDGSLRYDMMMVERTS